MACTQPPAFLMDVAARLSRQPADDASGVLQQQPPVHQKGVRGPIPLPNDALLTDICPQHECMPRAGALLCWAGTRQVVLVGSATLNRTNS